ncbi:ACT domain-containing protein [Pseudomonas sp. WOUb67]|uniref:ACT domain-containing protein n=1 Tax=Pseudomonas sp. WOUb67 TaxID=3161136 RepID=UPI003CEDC35B
MSGETSIAKLLSGMQPSLNPGEYVFCTLSDPAKLNGEFPIGTFREQEGLTAILERTKADALGLEYSYVAAWITLTIHSALEAVGLTAAFATALGNANISCNVIAAYYHDHIFVAKDDAQQALAVLQNLAKSSA